MVDWFAIQGPKICAAWKAAWMLKRGGVPWLTMIPYRAASWKKAFGTSPRKVGATEYWDDKAVSITDVLRGGMRG